MRNIRKGEQNSGKLRYHKRFIYIKWPIENYTLTFSIFSFFQQKYEFYQIFYNNIICFKSGFQGTFKVLLSHMIL